jgi:CspA family cold shock protein
MISKLVLFCQTEKIKRKRRFSIMSDGRIFGEVKWFSNERGYGFVTRDDIENEEYFVHFSSISMEGFKTLKAGQKVSFVLRQEEKGLQAKEVELEA